MELISREQAKSHGLKKYFTGKPCKSGHVSTRSTSTTTCDECKRLQNSEYHQENLESRKDYMRGYYRDNLDVVRESKRKNYQRKPWIQKSITAARRAAQKQRTPGWYGEFDWFVMNEAADLCSLRTIATGVEWHIDHMVPLQARRASGLHCGRNIQVLPAAMNLSKHNRMIWSAPDEWLRDLG